MFTTQSRYHDIERAEWTGEPGRTIVYARRRFLPSSAGVAPLSLHAVAGGDRLDNITARYLGDPTQFWRVADANDAMRPDDLTATVGRVLTIPSPSVGRP